MTPRPFDHKSKMRLLEHGAEWRHVAGPRPVHFATGLWTLLQSIKTDHLKWWPVESLTTETAS